MTIRNTNGPSPLLSTPSVPPTCPLNTGYAAGSVSISQRLQITGIPELDGISSQLDESAVKSDDEEDHSEELLAGGSRFSR